MKRFYLLGALAIVGCGDGVHQSTDIGEPIAVLHGNILSGPPTSASPDALRAALIWAALPPEMEACADRAADLGEIVNCFSSAGLQPEFASNDVALEPVFPSSFDIPLHHLPAPSALTGTPGALFGYAILVAYEDGNDNRMLDLVSPEATSSVDTVLGSTMTGAPDTTDSFLVYREGRLSPIWKMFGFIGCSEPPSGFSVVQVTMLPTHEIACVIHHTADAALTITFDDSQETRQLICEPLPQLSNYPESAPPAGTTVTCRDSGSLSFVVDASRYCPQTQYYDLIGCDSDLLCEVPEWDLSAAPPAWWPCGTPTVGSFSLEGSGVPLTSGADLLFRVNYLAGPATYPVAEIALWVEMDPTHFNGLTYPTFISHLDNDSDGTFSAGDVLELIEPNGLDLYNDTHSGISFPVRLVHDQGVSPVTDLADLIWQP